MAPPPRSYARLYEHGTSHTAGTVMFVSALFSLDRYRADRNHARPPIGQRQRGHKRMVKLEHLPHRTCWSRVRSGRSPSSRTGLITIGKHFDL